MTCSPSIKTTKRSGRGSKQLEQTQEAVTRIRVGESALGTFAGSTDAKLGYVNCRPRDWTQSGDLDAHGGVGQRGTARNPERNGGAHPGGCCRKIVSVSPHAAHLLLISSANSGVDALVQRSRVSGIVSGSIAGNCQLKYVQQGSDVAVGDVIITSGLDGVFPKGQQIGRVTRVATRDDKIFQDIEVTLSAELAEIEEVLVVAPTVVRAGAEPFRNE